MTSAVRNVEFSYFERKFFIQPGPKLVLFEGGKSSVETVLSSTVKIFKVYLVGGLVDVPTWFLQLNIY